MALSFLSELSEKVLEGVPGATLWKMGLNTLLVCCFETFMRPLACNEWRPVSSLPVTSTIGVDARFWS